MSKNFQISRSSTMSLLKKKKKEKKERKKKKEEELPPGVRRVISERNGIIMSWEKIGNRYKVKVKYPFCRILFEEFIVAPDDICFECKKSKYYALRLAQKRSAKMKNKFGKKG